MTTYLVAAFIFAFFLASISADITIIEPHANTVYIAGQNASIIWEWQSFTSNDTILSMELYYKTTFIRHIVNDTTNLSTNAYGSYIWKIPTDIPFDHAYTIHIKYATTEAELPDYGFTSSCAYFEIRAPTLPLNSYWISILVACIGLAGAFICVLKAWGNDRIRERAESRHRRGNDGNEDQGLETQSRLSYDPEQDC